MPRENVPAAELYGHLPSRCWTNRSREETSLGMISGLQHRLFVIHCHKQFSLVILCFKSRLKTISTRAFTEHCIQPAASTSEATTVWCYSNSSIIIVIVVIISERPSWAHTMNGYIDPL